MNELESVKTSMGFAEGMVAIEQERAMAEVKAKIAIAKQFPRSVSVAMANLIESCKSIDFAQAALYSVPNKGSGPSIRFAEEAARVYGNFDTGHKELFRDNEKSEVLVVAWDIENNNWQHRHMVIRHVKDTKLGPKPFRDQSEIDNHIANVAAKQMRGRILALLPKALIDAGIAECRRTLQGENAGKPIGERIIRMITTFKKLGISDKDIEKRLGYSVDAMNEDDIIDLLGVYNAIKDGAEKSEYFDVAENRVNASQALRSIANTQPAQQQAQAVTPTQTMLSAPKAATQPIPPQPTPQPTPEPQKQPEPKAQDAKQLELTNEPEPPKVDFGGDDNFF